jgi:hypothetical protein
MGSALHYFTGSKQHGVALSRRALYLRSSTAAVTGATITGNTTNGVVVANLSFATFTAGNTITSNGSPDIDCASTTAVTIGATSSTNTGGDTTDCVEPAP